MANGLEKPRPPTRSRASSTVSGEATRCQRFSRGGPGEAGTDDEDVRVRCDAHHRNPRCQGVGPGIHKLSGEDTTLSNEPCRLVAEAKLPTSRFDDLFDKQLSGTANFRVRDLTLDPGSKVSKEASYVDLLVLAQLEVVQSEGGA